MEDERAVEAPLDDDPYRMAFFPVPDVPAAAPQPAHLRVLLEPVAPQHEYRVGMTEGGSGVASAMQGLTFSSAAKPSFYGLPLRVRWELWVQVAGWRGDAAWTMPVYAHLEVGRDGHFGALDTLSGPGTAHTFRGSEAGLPCAKLLVYHLRADSLRLELRRAADREVLGFSQFRLKDLSPGVARCGWVKVKHPDKRAADGGRETVGALDVGLLVSDSLKAQTLFLLDLQERSVAFYQGVETLEDLNPVFTAPSLTPFSWTTDAKGRSFAVYWGKRVCATLEVKVAQEDTRVVSVVRQEGDEYWQCSITYEAADRRQFAVEGSWRGRISVVSSSVHVRRYEIVTEHGVVAAHAEQRNARDIKLSVDEPAEDPLVHVCLVLACTFTA